MSRMSARASRRVLVTGAGGFIGSHLTRDLLRSGDQVVALDLDLRRLADLESEAELRKIQGDLTDPALQREAVTGVDTVFHLAAAHLERSQPKEHFWRTNVAGTRSLAEAALRAAVRRFVHCSSVGVYGALDDPPADETTLCHPESGYELSKLEGEFAIHEVARAGLPMVILRPAWVYGEGCPRTAKLFEAVRRGRFLLAGKGDSMRHCLYIRDMVRALRRAATSERALGRVMIVGDVQAVRVRDLVGEIARLTGARPPRSVPLKLLSLNVVAAEAVFGTIGREPPVSRRSLRFFTGNTSFDTTLARRLLGCEPEYDLRRGLAETHAALYPDAGRPGREAGTVQS